jgi:hypothetical protein
MCLHNLHYTRPLPYYYNLVISKKDILTFSIFCIKMRNFHIFTRKVADLLTVAVDPCVFHIFGAVLVVGKIKQNCDVIRVLLISPLEKRLMKWTNYDFYVRLPT